MTNRRGGLSSIFLCCAGPGATTVASVDSGAGETGIDGLLGGSIIVASRAPGAGAGQRGSFGRDHAEQVVFRDYGTWLRYLDRLLGRYNKRR